MSITSFVKKVCVQTAVYWGNPVNDGFGNKTFDDPIEIKCRWDEGIRIVNDSTGKEFRSKADVMVTQDVDEEGFLYLGTLDSLSEVDDITKPVNIVGAFEIIAIDKTPLFRSTNKFVYLVHLGFANVQK